MKAEPDAVSLQEQPLQERKRLSAEARILAAVAHELKNPIQTLGNLLYLVGRELTNSTGRDYLTLAQQELSVLRSIVASTLGAVREQSSEAQVSLAEIINGSLRGYSEKISYKQITIERRIELIDAIQTSPVELRMIVDNTLSNALEAAPIGGKVIIHVSRARDWRTSDRSGYRIVIADNGAGIRPEHQGKIFEPFFTTKTEKGTGIGLWVVRRIVAKFGGTIHFRTLFGPGKTGTIFSIFLPIAEQTVPSSTPRVTKIESASSGST